MIAANQFGAAGPQPGDTGRVVQKSMDGDEVWLAVEFDGHPEFSFAWVAAWMVEEL